jgi:hypothetical protein
MITDGVPFCRLLVRDWDVNRAYDSADLLMVYTRVTLRMVIARKRGIKASDTETWIDLRE